ncbi:polyprotein [Birch leaf roll-associated virus]|uniref:RNA-directed DNA polymerase n=3 Tax=Birch leaf roll-associated virus TaxID=2057979 RepID=A0A2L0W0N6_9VIRU|nr:polyprotein [Birch leaf roll-associated virus]
MNRGRTVTVTERPPVRQTVSEHNTEIPTVEDQIRDYRRSQRRWYNARRRLRNAVRSLTPERGRTMSRSASMSSTSTRGSTRWTQGYDETLESELNPDAELQISQRRRARIIPAETLYGALNSEPEHRVYQHYSEQRVSLIDDQQDFRLIQPESYQALVDEGRQHIHVGMIMVRVSLLHRIDTGIQACIILRDTRFDGNRAIIGAMECDLSDGTAMVYLTPDMMLSIHDFYNHFQIAVMTRGYNNQWAGGESNMIITRSLIARLTNNSVTAFNYKVQGVLDYLTSKGVQALPGAPHPHSMLEGKEWKIGESKIPKPAQIPTRLYQRERTDGSTAIKFAGYTDKTASTSRPEDETEQDSDLEALMAIGDNDDCPEGTTIVRFVENIAPMNQEGIIIGETPTNLNRREWWTDPRWDSLDESGKEGGPQYLVSYTIPDRYYEISQDEIQPTGWDDEIPAAPLDYPEYVPSSPVWDDETEAAYYYSSGSSSDSPDEAQADFQNPFASFLGGEGDVQNEIAMTAVEDMDYPALQSMIKGLEKTTVAEPPKEKNTALMAESTGSGGGGNGWGRMEIQVNRPPGYAPATSTDLGYPTPTWETGGSSRQPRPIQMYRPPQPWYLPGAQIDNGVILVLPQDIGQYSAAVERWMTITLNVVNSRQFDSNQDKVNFIENLLGEDEKKIWISWRMAYEAQYHQIIANAGETQSILSSIRGILIGTDPYTGSVEEQNQAYRDIERLSCEKMGDVLQYMNAYKHLAPKTGRMWLSSELSEKFFRKLPPAIGEEIAGAFLAKYGDVGTNVMLRIMFTYQYLLEQCKRAAVQKSMKDLSFCKEMPLPGFYRSKKYGLRKAKTYNGKPHKTHVRVIRDKDKRREGTKCKCYLCGEVGHYARECKKEKRNINRSYIVDNTLLADGWDVVSVDPGEEDSDGIQSVSETEAVDSTDSVAIFREMGPYKQESLINNAFVLIFGPVPEANLTWMPQYPLSSQQGCCNHKWEEHTELALGGRQCSHCGRHTDCQKRAHCPDCKLTACLFCAKMKHGIEVKDDEKPERLFEGTKSLMDSLYQHNRYLLDENRRLKEENKELREANRALRNPALQKILETPPIIEEPQGEEELGQKLWGDLLTLSSPATTPRSKKGKEKKMEEGYLTDCTEEEAGVFYEAYTYEEADHTVAVNEEAVNQAYGKVALNRLYNMVVEFEIPQEDGPLLKFKLRAVLDTGATCCCVKLSALPEEAIMDSAMVSNFNGINSSQVARKRMKPGKMIIEGHSFKAPFIWAIQMTTFGIDMLIGCNFLRAMEGGLRIEGLEVTFYKNVTTIKTTMEPEKILAVEEEESLEFLELEEQAFHIATGSPEVRQQFQEKCRPLMEELKTQGFIGEKPLQHWSLNRIQCKLDIINPHLTIECRPLKHVTPAMKDQFKRHTDQLLKLGVIRPSSSRHRTMAIIVQSGTSIDPKTGKEIRGKERMVLDYRSLNQNTHKDQYSLPGINTIVQRIGNAKVFSKFDLKSGFHQVTMDEESIPWTAFLTPDGLYEWLVMPFGLKNAPAVFQRKMDNCFKGTEEFIAVYIDDILVFSENHKQHEGHLRKMLEIVRQNGLVLSPTKMKIACSEIDFLGATIGNSRIQLQPHIVQKIADKPEKEIMTTTGLRSWLGIINYARNYLPKCGTLLGPLYNKIGAHGDKRWKESDFQLVRQIKEMVQKLPALKLPPPGAYMVIETDGCMEGWGGICKWKRSKGDSRGNEHVCAYVSGKFSVPKSTIDAEIFAVMETLNSLKIYYLDKKEVTIRTDCQAIIAFYNKQAQHKPSRVRWLNFCDYITGTGVVFIFEHIKGTENSLADQLSRLATNTVGFSQCPGFQETIAEGLLLIETAFRELRQKEGRQWKKHLHHPQGGRLNQDSTTFLPHRGFLSGKISPQGQQWMKLVSQFNSEMEGKYGPMLLQGHTSQDSHSHVADDSWRKDEGWHTPSKMP